MVKTATSAGFITQIIGPVVDAEFPNGKLPKIYNAIIIGEGESAVTCEVQQLLGNNRVRAVSMTSTDGLNWTPRNIPGYEYTWRGITYGQGKFLAVSNTGTNRVMTAI